MQFQSRSLRRLEGGAFALLALMSLSSGNPPADRGAVGGRINAPKVSLSGPTSDKDVLVYLVPKKAQPVAALAPAVVTQKQLAFQPHVLPITKGTKVVFKNEDPVSHNVLCKDACGAADQDTEAKSSWERVYAETGVASITCRLHPDMSMYVAVLETPYFTLGAIEKVEVDGEKRYEAKYELTGVPPGDYTLNVWHKKLAPFAQDVTVAAGDRVALDLQLSK